MITIPKQTPRKIRLLSGQVVGIQAREVGIGCSLIFLSSLGFLLISSSDHGLNHDGIFLLSPRVINC